ncbi:MAG: DNA-binding protein [Methanomicrobiales archaeon]|nr:DNA-binding protein [Methanomicrobiales archaeon]
MKYAAGTCGRVFYLHIEHGEDPVATIQSFVQEKEVLSGVIHFIGAIKKAMLVTGPKEDVLPPDPYKVEVPFAHELIGTGFIRSGEGGPVVHIHVSAGRGEKALTGCLRGSAEVFILIEAVIMEFAGIEIPVMPDKKTGMMLPDPVISVR